MGVLRGTKALQIFRTTNRTVFSTNARPRFSSVVLDGDVMTFAPSQHPCVSVSRGPFKGLRQRQGSCWEERKRKVFPKPGVIDLLSRHIDDFLPTYVANIWLFATPLIFKIGFLFPWTWKWSDSPDGVFASLCSSGTDRDVETQICHETCQNFESDKDWQN